MSLQAFKLYKEEIKRNRIQEERIKQLERGIHNLKSQMVDGNKDGKNDIYIGGLDSLLEKE